MTLPTSKHTQQRCATGVA